MHGIPDAPPANPPRAADPEESERPARQKYLRQRACRKRRRNPAPGNRRGRKWLAHFVHHDRHIGLRCLRNRPPSHMSAQRDEHRKRNEKFARCREPNPMAYSCVILSQRKCQQSRDSCEQSRLPQVICKRRHVSCIHFGLSSPASFKRAFSASRTSSRVSVPDSTKWAMMGRLRPPNKPRSSSTSLRCAASRDTAASKMSAVAIFLVRRSAFLTSRR